MAMKIDLTNVRFFGKSNNGTATEYSGEKIFIYDQDVIIIPKEINEAMGFPRYAQMGELDTLYLIVPFTEPGPQTYKVQFGGGSEKGNIGRLPQAYNLRKYGIGIPGFIVWYPAIVVDGVCLIEKKSKPNVVRQIERRSRLGKNEKRK